MRIDGIGDAELVRCARDGDREAFAELVRRHRDVAYRVAGRLLGSSELAGGARVREVRVTRVAGQTFYAEVVVEAAGQATAVDARPSDALNLALVAGAPIRVDAALLTETRDEVWRRYPTGAAELGRVTSGTTHR